MNKTALASAFVAVALTFSACGLSNAIKGGLIGTGAGAAVGAGIGRVAGNTGLGSVIGAAVGGAAGALIGNKMDQQKKELEASMPAGTSIEAINDGQAIKVTFDSGILFATNSSDLSNNSRSMLAKFAESTNNNPDTDLKIIGHTDNTGSDKVNDPLSMRRAKSVYDYLAGRGVATQRMIYEGKGSHEPIAENTTAEGRRQNRRVEVFILPNAKMIQDAKAGTLK